MKTITLHKDYYNNITAEELEGLYSIGRFMGKFELERYILLILATLFEIYVFVGFVIRVCDRSFIEILKNDPFSVIDSFGTLAVAVLLIIFCVFDFRRLRRSRYFYFGKGRIISVKNEHIENSRYEPDGYYRNILTIAVSEEEAVSVYYISDAPMDEEIYIGREAIAVYYPYIRVRFAVMTGSSPADYVEKYGDIMMEKKNRGKNID